MDYIHLSQFFKNKALRWWKWPWWKLQNDIRRGNWQPQFPTALTTPRVMLTVVVRKERSDGRWLIHLSIPLYRGFGFFSGFRAPRFRRAVVKIEIENLGFSVFRTQDPKSFNGITEPWKSKMAKWYFLLFIVQKIVTCTVSTLLLELRNCTTNNRWQDIVTIRGWCRVWPWLWRGSYGSHG